MIVVIRRRLLGRLVTGRRAISSSTIPPQHAAAAPLIVSIWPALMMGGLLMRPSAVSLGGSLIRRGVLGCQGASA